MASMQKVDRSRAWALFRELSMLNEFIRHFKKSITGIDNEKLSPNMKNWLQGQLSTVDISLQTQRRSTLLDLLRRYPDASSRIGEWKESGHLSECDAKEMGILLDD